MLHIHDLTKHFGPQTIFANASVHIPAKTRVGLVGPNGAGKTTLLRLLSGEELPDSGRITLRKGARLGYLKQEVWEHPERSILDEVMLATSYEFEAKRILGGVGFKPHEVTMPLRHFSGGFMMRVALAKLLVGNADLLLLDEPTNHLDLETIVWLEQFLLDYPGTSVITTHDQVFMQNVAQRIIEVNKQKLDMYVGDFESYVEQKAARQEQLEAAWTNQQKQLQHTEKFISRFRYKASKARQVQSRIKQLEKVARIELDNAKTKTMTCRLPQPKRSGHSVVQLQGVAKHFGNKVVYNGLNLEILRGQKVALVGPNGAGKSTLLKIIAKVLPVDAGQVTYGYHVEGEYYAQHQLEKLNPEATILEEMTAVSEEMKPEQRRAILGAFLFSGDDVQKTIRVLSGGEKARVALAKMLGRPANLLVMDEPTNHLDILSRQVLQEALAEYQGTLVFVSHDRALINGIATHVLEVGGKDIELYPGTYDEFLWHKEQVRNHHATTLAPDTRTNHVTGDAPPEKRSKKDERRERAQRLQERNRELRPLKVRLEQLEALITAHENEKTDLVQALCDPAVIAQKEAYVQKMRRQYEVEALLDKYLDEWSQVSEQLDSLEQASTT